jgi:glycosyltransferase involved in cell wall biosynthesis
MQDKPRVLFLIDIPGWAHDHKSRNIMQHLGDDFSFRCVYYDTVKPEDLDWADAILIYFWQQYKVLRNRGFEDALLRNQKKLMIGICSFIELEGPWLEQGLAILNQHAQRVFIHNKLLLETFKPQLQVPVHFTPNGVDTQFFTPKDRSPGKLLRIGWAGSVSNHSHKRGYFDFILPAVCSLSGIEFVPAAREWLWRDHAAMRTYYRELDVYLCASRTEGTPNPCLEAAACGLTLVSTPVGNMPELIRDGENGFLVARDVHAIAAKLAFLRDDRELCSVTSQQIRRDILSWDWSQQALAYGAMLRAQLAVA